MRSFQQTSSAKSTFFTSLCLGRFPTLPPLPPSAPLFNGGNAKFDDQVNPGVEGTYVVFSRTTIPFRYLLVGANIIGELSETVPISQRHQQCLDAGEPTANTADDRMQYLDAIIQASSMNKADMCNGEVNNSAARNFYHVVLRRCAIPARLIESCRECRVES